MKTATLIFIGTVLALTATGKVNEKERLTNAISLEKEGYVYKINTLVEAIDRPCESKITYHWYWKHALHSNKGGYSGLLLHGSYEKFDRNNRLCEKGYFQLGSKHGIWKKWDFAGNLESVETWKNGQKHGETHLYKNGVLNTTQHYVHHQLDGQSTVIQDSCILVSRYKKGELKKQHIVEKYPEKKKRKEKKTKDLDSDELLPLLSGESPVPQSGSQDEVQ